MLTGSDGHHVGRRNEEKLGRGVDEARDEPGARDAVDTGTFTGDRFHGVVSYGRKAKMTRPAAAPAAMSTGSGTLKRQMMPAATSAMSTVGRSKMARRASTKQAPAMAPEAAAVTRRRTPSLERCR